MTGFVGVSAKRELVGNGFVAAAAITIGILRVENIGRGTNEDAFAPGRNARDKGEIIGEDGAVVEYAISIAIFEHPDLVIGMRRHLVVIERVAGRLA